MNDFSQAVYEAWAGCCGAKRQLPFANVLLAALIDPEHVERGARVNLWNDQYQGILTAIDRMNTNLGDKLDSINTKLNGTLSVSVNNPTTNPVNTKEVTP